MLTTVGSYSHVDLDFIAPISLTDMYDYIAYLQNERHASAGYRSRKIVSIRQFWKYLKNAHVMENDVADELETPMLPKRIPKYLSLEESVRLLIVSKDSIRDHCILTIMLNCALRISELVSLDISHVSSNIITVIGKGNKERRIFLTPAAKTVISNWLSVRQKIDSPTDALFISRSNQRLAIRSVQDIIKKYVLLAGLDPAVISAHKLRHTSATLMYKYGKADIRSLQQILGHESIATTEIYTHVDDSQLQAAVNANPLAIMFNSDI